MASSHTPKDSVMKGDSDLWQDTPEAPLNQRFIRILQFLDRFWAWLGVSFSFQWALETVGKKSRRVWRDFDWDAFIRHFSILIVIITVIAYIVLAIIHSQ